MLNINQKPDAVGAGKQAVLAPLVIKWVLFLTWLLNTTRKANFLAPLAFRLFLAPIFITFGLNKGFNFTSTAAWFGNPDWGLGLPFPELLATLAIGAEVIGGFCLLLGVLTRWMSLPLMVTMVVAMWTAHLDNGWHAIAPSDPQTNIAVVTQYVGFPGAQASLENSIEVKQRLDQAKSILKQHGNFEYLTDKGPIVVLNNGIEFGFIYFAMLLSLFFTGAGLLSIDHLFVHKFMPWLMRRS